MIVAIGFTRFATKWPVMEFWTSKILVLETNIPGKMAWAGHSSLKTLVQDWNIGLSCKNGLCSDGSGVVASFKCLKVLGNQYIVRSLRYASAASCVAMLACLAGVARSDRDNCMSGANKKNLPNCVQCTESDIEGVICEPRTAKRSTAWTTERNIYNADSHCISLYILLKGTNFFR